jgi:hypothetical protein
MKSKILMILVVIFTIATASWAQVRATKGRHQPKSPEERAEMMTKRLSKRLELSPQQTQKLGAINKEAAVEMSFIRKEVEIKKAKNENFDRKDYQSRAKAIQERREQQTIALLNEKQKAEYIKLKTELSEKRKKRQEMRKKHHKKDTGMWLEEDFLENEA